MKRLSGFPSLKQSIIRDKSNTRSHRNSNYELASSNTNNKSQLEEDIKYKLFAKGSSSESSKHSMDSKKGMDDGFEFNQINTSIIEQDVPLDSSSHVNDASILSITLERKLKVMSQFNRFKLQKMF